MRVKVDLQLPYAFETSRDQIFLARIQEQYPGLKGQDLRERAARWLTEDFIVSAAQMVFPGGMGIAEAQPFGKIHSQCGRREMELEKPEFIFLANLFFSEESRKLVRFNAQVAGLLGEEEVGEEDEL